MNRRDLFATCAAAFGLAGCWRRTYKWNQKVTVVVDTPEGERSGSAVSEIAVIVGRLPMSGNILDGWGRGESTVVDLPDGKLLLATLIGASWEGNASTIVERIFAKNIFYDGKMSEEDFLNVKFSKLSKIRGKVQLSGRTLPLLVTFADMSDPNTLRVVKPDNLAAAFGPGYALKSVMLELTDEPQTAYRLPQLMNWRHDEKKRHAFVVRALSAGVPPGAANFVEGIFFTGHEE